MYHRGPLGAGVFACLLSASACSSTSTGAGAGAACKVEGLYIVSYAADSTTCQVSGEQSTSTVTYTVTKADATHAQVTRTGTPGGCNGALDGCKFTASCDIANDAGVVIMTQALSMTFNEHGFVGTESWGLRPPAVAKACSVEWSTDGVRK